MITNTYGRNEKLKKKTDIEMLFREGIWISTGNVRLIFLPSDTNKTLIGVSVSKRNFKRAVARNRIKRLLREYYRLHKKNFAELFPSGVYAMLFWTSRQMPQHYSEVKTQCLQLLDNVEKKISEKKVS